MRSLCVCSTAHLLIAITCVRTWPAGRRTLRVLRAPIIFIFVKNIFVNGRIITKFTKILYCENLELYGTSMTIPLWSGSMSSVAKLFAVSVLMLFKILLRAHFHYRYRSKV